MSVAGPGVPPVRAPVGATPSVRSRLALQRAGGLSTAQMLRCLRALIGALDSEHDAVACPPPANPL